MISQPVWALAADGGHGAAGEASPSACACSQGREILLETGPCWDAPSLGTVGCESTKALQPPGSRISASLACVVLRIPRSPHPSCTAAPRALQAAPPHVPSQLCGHHEGTIGCHCLTRRAPAAPGPAAAHPGIRECRVSSDRGGTVTPSVPAGGDRAFNEG